MTHLCYCSVLLYRPTHPSTYAHTTSLTHPHYLTQPPTPTPTHSLIHSHTHPHPHHVERRKKERQEQELMEMIQDGDYDEAELMQYVKTQTLQSSRESKLGTQLKESTVRRIILIVYSMFFIVPLLIYYPTDKGPNIAIQVAML